MTILQLFSIITGIINGLLGVLKEISIPLLAYFQGKKSEKLENAKEELKYVKEKEKIMDDNKLKSSNTILDELRDNDSRRD